MVEIANLAVTKAFSGEVKTGSRKENASTASGAREPERSTFTPLAVVNLHQWRALAERAAEPSGYYLPDWELAVNATARGRTGASALSAFSDAVSGPATAAQLIGLIPVTSMWRAFKIPLPAWISAQPYGTLCTPLLDRDLTEAAATGLIAAALGTGAHALVLRDVSINGAAIKSFRSALRQTGTSPVVLRSHRRACLDARRDADALLQDALGSKKLKELRRQRHRLAEHGDVRFEVARTFDAVTVALETFLRLEASGWKARRGTALIQDDGDAGFIRRAAPALAASGQCEIVTLHAGDIPVAAAVVLRHQDRAFYFKLGVDERFAKFSPGVQLTLDLTRHLCADPAIATADSTASPDHPMINPIWRGRLEIGDVLIPLRRHDPVVSLIHATLAIREFALQRARRVVRWLRKRK